MAKIKGKAIKILNPALLEIDFYGLKVLTISGSYGEKENEGERQFQKANPSFVHWPVTFYFSGIQYTPDFYDPETHIFFEIIGTSQRYYQGQNRMLRARRWIGAKIILCTPEGERLIPRFKHGERSYPINKIVKVGQSPIATYFQDDYGKTIYTNKKEVNEP